MSYLLLALCRLHVVVSKNISPIAASAGPIVLLNSEGVNACDRRAQNQRVNVVRSLVGFHRLKVRHVTEYRILIRNSVCTKNVACQAGALQSHPRIVSLGHGNVEVLDLILILQPAHLKRQQLSLADFGDHPDQLLLNQLMRRDGLVAELLAKLLHIAEQCRSTPLPHR